MLVNRFVRTSFGFETKFTKTLTNIEFAWIALAGATVGVVLEG